MCLRGLLQARAVAQAAHKREHVGQLGIRQTDDCRAHGVLRARLERRHGRVAATIANRGDDKVVAGGLLEGGIVEFRRDAAVSGNAVAASAVAEKEFFAALRITGCEMRSREVCFRRGNACLV